MKMGRRPPDRRPILIATKAMLFMGRDTGWPTKLHMNYADLIVRLIRKLGFRIHEASEASRALPKGNCPDLQSGSAEAPQRVVASANLPKIDNPASGRAEGRGLSEQVTSVPQGQLSSPPAVGDCVMIIDSVYPRTDRDSGSVGVFNFIRIFQKLGLKVFFGSTSEYEIESDYKHHLQSLDVVVVDKRFASSLDEFIRVAGSEMGIYFLSGVDAGGVFFDTIRTLASRSKIIFNMVDFQSFREFREARLSGNRSALNLAFRTREHEIYLSRLSDATIVGSAVGIELLEKSAPGCRVFHAPLIHDNPRRTNDLDAGARYVGEILKGIGLRISPDIFQSLDDQEAASTKRNEST